MTWTSFPGESYKQAAWASMALINSGSFISSAWKDLPHFDHPALQASCGEAVPHHHPLPRADLIQLSSECLLFTDFYCSSFQSESMVLQTSSIRITWDLIRNIHFQASFQTYWISNSGGRAQQSLFYLTSLPGDFDTRSSLRINCLS